ncbi:MAG: hypothetical protein PHI97_04630 [Desulfobulbus sp.]|nr:hypothetical protein [Desulfobulbus sp.]
MKQIQLIATLLTAATLCCPLLTGCQDQQAKEQKKPPLQQQLGQEAARSIEKPLAEAHKAAELQSAGDQKIKEAAQTTQEKKKLEGC